MLTMLVLTTLEKLATSSAMATMANKEIIKMPPMGRTPESWRKHEIIELAELTFLGAAAEIFRGTRGIIIDMHAGDADGVPHPQGDLFHDNFSSTTPAIAERIVRQHPVTVLLCEKHRRRRESLAKRFGTFSIIGDHAGAYEFVDGLRLRPVWGVCVSDANGHGKMGIEHMQRLGKLMPRLDFVIVFPQGGARRHIALDKNGKEDDNPQVKGAREAVEKYEWMLSTDMDRFGHVLPSIEWADRLGRRMMAVTRLISASPGFAFRVIVVSNYLPHGITRNRRYQFQVLE